MTKKRHNYVNWTSVPALRAFTMAAAGGENAWKMEDIPEAIEAARIAGLANFY